MKVSEDITEVKKAVNEIANSSAHVKLNAQELSKLAEDLDVLVLTFKI